MRMIFKFTPRSRKTVSSLSSSSRNLLWWESTTGKVTPPLFFQTRSVWSLSVNGYSRGGVRNKHFYTYLNYENSSGGLL